MAIADAGQNIDINIRVIDKYSKGFKDAGTSAGKLGKETTQLANTVDTGSKKMTKSVDFFENNSSKALKKAGKSFAGLGGAFGNIAEDFSLGAGIAVGAIGFMAKKVIDEIKRQDEAFLNFSKTVKETGMVFSGTMQSIVQESEKISKATDNINKLQTAIDAARGSARGGLGIFDRIQGYTSIEQKEAAKQKELAGALAVKELEKQGKIGPGGQFSVPEFQAEKSRQQAIIDREAADQILIDEYKKRQKGLELSSQELDAELAKQAAQESAIEKHRALIEVNNDERNAAISLANAMFNLKNTNVSTTNGAVALALQTQQLNAQFNAMTPAMQAVTNEVRNFLSAAGTTTRRKISKGLHVGAEDTGALLRQRTFELFGGVGEKDAGPGPSRTSNPSRPGGAGSKGSHFNDASMFITSRGEVMTFNPSDNISLNASKNGNAGNGVTIIVQGSLVTWDEVMDRVETHIGRKLKSKVSIGTI